MLLYADHRVIQLQSVGYAAWVDDLGHHADTLREMLGAYAVADCTELLLSCRGFFDLGMDHVELADLFSRRLLAQRDAIESFCPGQNDGFLRIMGKKDELIIRVNVSPMSTSDVETSLNAEPNLEQIRGNDKFDIPLKGWRDSMLRDSLFVEVQAVRNNVAVVELAHFFKDATNTCDELARNLTKLIRALPTGAKK